MGVLIFVSGIIDYKYRRIPNIMVILILLWTLFFSSAPVYERCAGLFVTAIPLFVLALTTGKLKGGDYKFFVSCAAALGLSMFVNTLFFATFAAIVWSIVRKEKSVPLAFVFMVGYVIYLIL